jgi:3D (Asp-Asp-Asp) domain-containing protein
MKWILLLPLTLCSAITGFTDEHQVIKVIAICTAYCGGSCCCGTFPGKVPLQTASGAKAKQGRTLAMPKSFPFGTRVYSDGKLLGICEDRGGAIKMKGGKVRIDIYMDSHKEALKFGKREIIVEIKKEQK